MREDGRRRRRHHHRRRRRRRRRVVVAVVVVAAVVVAVVVVVAIAVGRRACWTRTRACAHISKTTVRTRPFNCRVPRLHQDGDGSGGGDGGSSKTTNQRLHSLASSVAPIQGVV